MTSQLTFALVINTLIWFDVANQSAGEYVSKLDLGAEQKLAESLEVTLMQSNIQMKMREETRKNNDFGDDGTPGYTADLVPNQPKFPYYTEDEPTLSKYPPYMIGAVYGVDDSIGYTPGLQQNITLAAELGLNIQNNVTNGMPQGNAQLTCLNPLISSANGTAPSSYPLDAVPVHFSWPVKRNDIGMTSSLHWYDFEFTRSDGSRVKPWCVTLIPQNDANEGFTVLTMTPALAQQESITGGGAIGPQPQTVRIVDDLILSNGTHDFNVKGAAWTGGNLDYSKGAVLVEAYVKSFKPDENKNYSREGNDPCPPYPSTTHVLTVAGIGGLTRDGVTSLRANQTELFTVYKTNNERLPKNRFLQLADLDVDDIIDLCLNLADGEAEQLDIVDMQCQMQNADMRVALPKGLNMPCTATQPQRIAQISCPDSNLCR